MGSIVSLLLAPLLRIFSLVGGEGEEEEPQLVSELLESLAEEDNDDQEVRILWNRLCRRLRQSPEEAACYCHTVDPSPLLQCLTNTPESVEIPLEVIATFLEAYEDAVHTSDGCGTTPLLAAARRASYDITTTTSTSEGEEEDTHISSIISLLLKTYPFAAQQPDKKGRLPLHYVRSHVETARAVLKAYPSAVAQKDENGRLPLHYYCELTREEETQNDDSRIQQQQLTLPNIQIAKLLLEAATAKSTTTSPVVQKDKKGIAPLDLFYQSVDHVLLQNERHPQVVDQLWDILTLLVQSATPSPTTPLVHALVSLHCPPAVLQEALRRFPHQATERDAQGCTPLLLAVQLLDDEQSNTNTQQVVAFLLRSHPRAARMTDPEGRLAIDVLSEKCHAYSPELYDLLVSAEPRAVGTRDLKNKQHPFLTAALAGNGSGVYHLLRAQPHVIRYFLNEC